MSKIKRALGVILDSGAEHQDDPKFDTKLKVRIFEIHGYGELASFKNSEKNYVPDEKIPWIDLKHPDTFGYALNGSEVLSIDNILSYKAYNYEPGDIVVVESNKDANDRRYVVVGLRAKYSEDYFNGIDLSKVVENAPKFNLNFSNSTPSNPDDNPDDYSPSGSSITDVNNLNTKWKDYFGCPFAHKSDYIISCKFGVKGSWSLGYHPGIDFGHPNGGQSGLGTPIYSVGNGTVVGVNSEGSSYGNHVVVKHQINGTNYYTLYAHMRSISVKNGQSVQGTQNGNSGTKLGERGYTGRVYPSGVGGTHLHFEVRVGANKYSSDTCADPSKYIAI